MQKKSKATASDVAKIAGVSKWTVSRAFTPGASVSEDARERVLKAAAELAYRPNLLAQGLKNKSMRIIGIAIDEFSNPHGMVLLSAATKELQARGYTALLLNVTEGEDYQSVMGIADQLKVDGILFLANVLSDELFEVANSMHGIPLVQVARNSGASRGIDIVNADGYRAGQEIAQLLLGQGYRRFGYMKGPDTETEHLLRLDGYRDELLSAGAQLDLLLIADHYDRRRGYETMQAYLQHTQQQERVDAMFCENDILALGALEAMHVSQQDNCIAIVGFDGIDEADSPVWGLTSYNQNAALQIAEAVNRLTGGVANEDSSWRKGELTIRRSHIKKI